MSASNSISHLLEQFLELNSNSLETFERINEAITTDKQTVTVNIFDEVTGELKPLQIPAFGYLKREIERLDKNVKAISGLDNSSANIRLKDGSFRRIHTSKLKSPAKDIKNLSTPVNFKTKLNEFFEDFLNPLLTINLDVTGQIPVETERVYVERYIFDSNVLASLTAFDEIYKGESEIDYTTFKNEIAENNYQYYVDSEVVDMPMRQVQYKGTFDVLNVSNEQKSQVVDGVTNTKSIKLFTLNKLTYSDSSKSMRDTEVLRIGDSLVVNSGNYNTRYEILSIDNSTLQVELKLLEGFENIPVGADSLVINKGIDTNLEVEVKIGYNERQVVFIKAIDPVSKLPSNEYSPGIGFYSNELTIILDDGTEKNLALYYKDSVADFGQFIKSLKVDYIPPASEGIQPNSPILNTSNFKVVQINKHMTDNTTTEQIKQLKADKSSAEQQLTKLDDTIRKKRALFNTKKFQSKIEKDNLRSELSSLVSQRESESKFYSSAVTQIKSASESSDVAKITPKFRVRGFWSIPEAKTVGEGVSQEVVQFKIRYRYVSTSGKTSQIEQIQFEDSTNDTSKTAAFSNWVEVEGPVRKRQKLEDGRYSWVIESEEDAQAINFNSLDVPINSGEVVEIMVKSLSEAGFPSNPVESDWSDIIKVEFPDGELNTDGIGDVLTQNELDNLKVELQSDLDAQGLYTHLSDGFNSNETYFAHSATNLASGFLTGEQSPISVYDKLAEMQATIDRLTAAITGAVGELKVSIVDEDGNVTPVKNNSTVKLFAGYYTDEVPATDKKGFIVTKNYKIELTNTKSTTLELVSKLVGDVTQPAFISTTGQIFGLGSGSIDSAVTDNTYYTTEGKYDLVPVAYQNIDAAQASANAYFNESPNQSTQLNGQFIYSRFKNLANSDAHYTETDLDSTDETGYDKFEYGLGYHSCTSGYTGTNGNSTDMKDWSTATTNSFTNNGVAGTDYIWAGTYDTSSEPELVTINTVTTATYDNGIFLHVDHPLINSHLSSQPTGTPLTALEIQSNGMVGIPKTAPRRANDTSGKKQTPLRIIDNMSDDGANPGVRTVVKQGFEANDQYLLGGKSCGSFLYLAPINTSSIVVDSNNKFGKKRISAGDGNSISVDLVFQYRMTDYSGDGATGTGRVGGVLSNTFTNLTYSKKIGIDIEDSFSNSFSFDVEVFSKYKSTGRNINSITSKQLTRYRLTGGGSGSYRTFISGENDFSSDIQYNLRYLQ